MRSVAVVVGLVLACGCTSAAPTESADTVPVVSTVPVPVVTTSNSSSTTAVSSTTTELSSLVPPVPEPGDLLAQPELLSSVEEGILVAARSATDLLWLEPTDRRVPGCEADTDPAWRFFRQDLVSGTETTFFEQTDTERWFPWVHHTGRVALLTGCDANAWLDGVGSLEGDGSFTKTLRGDQMVFYGNNAPLSLTWTADGETLFLNWWHIDARTAEIIEGPDGAGNHEVVRAVLADGSAILETRTGEGAGFDFVAGDGSRTLNVAEESVWNFPVEVAGDGANALIRFTDFGEVEGARSVIVGAVGSVNMAGLAWFSPSGDRLLVQRDQTRWDITDLTGAVAQTVELSNPLAEVEWTHDESGLVIQTGRLDPESTITVSYLEIPPFP